MNLKLFLAIIQTFAYFICTAQITIGRGDEPQITSDLKNVVRLVYGNGDSIYYALSTDKGKTFSKPTLVAEVPEMQLGMSRGPQITSSKDYSVVTSMDKQGNIHAYRLTHRSGQWQKIGNVNDSEGSAPEGLMSIASDDNNNFFAVWLDLREERQNNICFSVLKRDGHWDKNKFVYKSPDGHVCECCKPSIVVNGNHVSIMFRNWLMGSRDLYLISSSDRGEKFTGATRLGNDTWHLNGCPMDGGGITINTDNHVRTAWQRQGYVYSCEPGKSEERIGEGRAVGINSKIVFWEKGQELFIKNDRGVPQKIGEGSSLSILQLTDRNILAIWSSEKRIMIKQL